MGDQGVSSSWEQGASSWETASHADTAAQGGQGSGRQAEIPLPGRITTLLLLPKKKPVGFTVISPTTTTRLREGQSTSAGGAYQSDYGGQQGYQQPYSDYRSTGSTANNHQRVSPIPTAIILMNMKRRQNRAKAPGRIGALWLFSPFYASFCAHRPDVCRGRCLPSGF